MTIGKKIKQRRLELNITQTELAKKLGYSDRTIISKMESGVNGIPANKLELLASILDVSVEYLTGCDTHHITTPSNMGDTIKMYRQSLGLTQDELARRVGYSHKGIITKIEHGTIPFPTKRLEAFANALNTTPEVLLNFDSDAYKSDIYEPSDKPITKDMLEELTKKYNQHYNIIDEITKVYGNKTAYYIEKFLQLPIVLQENVFIYIDNEYDEYIKRTGIQSMPSYEDY